MNKKDAINQCKKKLVGKPPGSRIVLQAREDQVWTDQDLLAQYPNPSVTPTAREEDEFIIGEGYDIWYHIHVLSVEKNK